MWPFGKPLTGRVQDAINQWPPLQGLGLQVSDNRGAISISGVVPREPHKSLLESAVQGVKGVRSVDLSGVMVAQQEVSDAAIAQAEADNSAAQAEAHASASADALEAEIQKHIQASALAKKVLNHLEANGELKDDPIDVLQKGTTVVLRGAVDSQHEFNLAVQLAEKAGATGVDTSGLQVVGGAKEKYAAEQPGYVNIPDEWYTVQAGDTLSEIAQKFYGDGSRDSYMKIVRANNIADANKIQVGQKLQIPR